MKKILLIALLLIPFLGFSQITKPIEGFLGIKFGTGKAEVVAAIKAKGGIIDSTSANYVEFTHVNLGHRPARWFFVKFINDQAFEAGFLFYPEADDKVIDYYNSLNSDIADIYGKGEPRKVFRSTFKDGDGYELTAIENGDADYSTQWTDSNNNFIKSTITMKMRVWLFYVNGALQKIDNAKAKEKEKGDF